MLSSAATISGFCVMPLINEAVLGMGPSPAQLEPVEPR
jgi:hypothetical protein